MRGKSPASYSVLTAQDMIKAIRSIDGPDVEAIVAFGANLPFAKLADEAERWLDKPVLQINATTYWHALRTNGITDKVYGYGSLMPWKYSRPRLKVMGPGGLEEEYPSHPPRRAMTQAAQARDVRGVWISLFGGAWRVLIGLDGMQSVDLGVGEGDRSGLERLSVARLNQLHDQGRGVGCDGGELEQAIGGFELTVLEAQAVLLQGPEQLFDGPALLVPVDDCQASSRLWT